MFGNQHRDVTVSRQDDGEFNLVSYARTSETSTNTQNSVRVYERIKLVQRAESFHASLSLLSEDSAIGVIIFLLRFL